ncbi:unnamed protein product [Urochloa humidicola]
MSPSPSLLPLKKRALNDGSSSSRRPDPDDSSSSSPNNNKRPANNDGAAASAAAETEDAAGARDDAPAVPRRRRRPPPPRADAPSAAERWLEKAKWVATDQDQPQPLQAPSPAPPPPPAKKLMQDGIRSLAAAAARDDERKKSKAAAAAPAIVLGAALRLRLAELCATRPRFVYRKALQKSDVCPNQNRLLVSCKRETLEGCPITPVFSAREWARVENKDAGLLVTALDGRGDHHALTCKFLDSNGGYRFISGWKGFLRRNGVALDSRGRWTRAVDVEVLAFRSRALPRQPAVDAAGRLDRATEVGDHLHPDGSLGLVLLLHEHAGRRRDDEAEDDDGDYDEGTVGSSPPVAREKKGKKEQREKREDAAPVAAEVGEAEASMSKVEMVGKYGESMSNMVVGIMMLRGTISKEKESQQDNIVEGDAAFSKEKESRGDVEGGAVLKEESRENMEGDAILLKESGDNVEGGGAISVEGDAILKESEGNVQELGSISEERRDNADVDGADMALG